MRELLAPSEANTVRQPAKLAELARKLWPADPEPRSAKLAQLLSHLPFVHILNNDDEPSSSIVELLNPRSIARSFADTGAAQCFLVISISGGTGTSSQDEQPVALTLADIDNFVKE